LTAPLLVFGWGNPSRGDDALGPELVRRLGERHAAAIARGELELLTDFQLQPEHALDLRDRARVLFVDAAARGEALTLSTPTAAKDASFSSHLLSPAALLQTFLEVEGRPAPPCTLLAIRGEGFELGAPLSAAAEANLVAALEAVEAWLGQPASA